MQSWIVSGLEVKDSLLRWTDVEPASGEPDNVITLSNELTVVTAYFHIGNIPKGSPSAIRTPDTYRRWMTIFARLDNPLVAYVDSARHEELF